MSNKYNRYLTGKTIKVKPIKFIENDKLFKEFQDSTALGIVDKLSLDYQSDSKKYNILQLMASQMKKDCQKGDFDSIIFIKNHVPRITEGSDLDDFEFLLRKTFGNNFKIEYKYGESEGENGIILKISWK